MGTPTTAPRAESDRATSPEDRAGCISRVCFCWVWSAVVGPAYARESTTKSDLPPPSIGDSPSTQHQLLDRALKAHARAGKPLDWVGLFALTVRTQWSLLLRATLLMLVNVAAVVGQPLVLELLLDELDAPSISVWRGLLLASGIFALTAVGVVAVHSFWFEAQRAGIRSTIALSTEVFRRTLSLDPRGRARFGEGRLTQLMGVDAERLSSSYALPLITWGSWPPLAILGVGIWNLHRLLGWPALVAAAMLGLTPFVNAGCISGRIRAAQARVQRRRDDRIRAATEAIANARALKVLGWEAAALRRVFRLRRRELRAVWSDLMWRVVSGVFVLAVPLIATSTAYSLYALVVGRPMRASVIFASSAWLGTLSGPMWQIPAAIRCAVTTSVSFGRLADFFWTTGQAAALARSPVETGGGAAGVGPSKPTAGLAPGVTLSGVDISWPVEDEAPREARAGACWLCRGWGRFAAVVCRMLGAAACCCCPPGLCAGRSEPRSGRKEGSAKRRTRAGHAASAGRMPLLSVNADPEEAMEDEGGGRDVMVLSDARLLAGPGLTVVLGATGSGKSSLVGAFTGAPLVSGPAPEVRGSLSYVGQRPWLSNATVRENVCLDRPFSRRWFDVVVDACALREDLAAFPAGEDTQIGERGISISGGQRARLALARAVYADADVVLLDDPLAALDAKVAAHVLQHCVFELLVDRGKAVVMCTNLVSLARDPRAAAVYLVEGGRGGAPGSVRPLSADEAASVRLEGEAAALPTAPDSAGTTDEASSPGLASPPPLLAAASSAGSAASPLVDIPARAIEAVAARDASAEPTLLAPMVGPKEGAAADLAALAADVAAAAKDADASASGSPVRGAGAEEVSRTGFVRFRVFLRYCSACGPPAFTAAVSLVLCLREVLMVGADVWLTVWVDAEGGPSDAARPAHGGSAASAGAFDGGIALSWLCGPGAGGACYATVYSALQAAVIVAAVAMWLLVSGGSITAARRMHDGLMTSLLAARQSFFDSTPTGLVVNRAVKDMQKVDLSVGPTVRGFVINALRLSAAVLLVSVGSPWVIVAMALLALPYYALALRFRHAARDLQRLSSASNSPLLSLFGEVSKGAHVVRTFAAEAAFLARHRVLALAYASRATLLMAVEQWATVWLEVFGALVVLATAVLLVLARAEGAIPVAIVGFLLTQAQSVPSRLLWVTRQYASLELALVAAERIFEFEDLPSEDDPDTAATPAGDGRRARACCRGPRPAPPKLAPPAVTALPPAAPVAAPAGASLHIDGVTLSYTGVGKPALRGVSLRVEPGAKVAVVGRSGAGKSSILSALLRTHPFTGAVRVDGRDLSALPCRELRRHFATLSQEATVFEGSVRDNLLGLDPVPSPSPGRRKDQHRAAMRARGMAPAQQADAAPSRAHDLARDELAARALRAVGLSRRLPSLSETLESSESLSRGQAQLLGLARCLVRLWESGAGVVLADEATSSVDRGADTRVHDVLFGLPQTVVSICHRLDHIERFDQVVVMSGGKVAELGSPATLLRESSSRLSGLVRHFRAANEDA